MLGEKEKSRINKMNYFSANIGMLLTLTNFEQMDRVLNDNKVYLHHFSGETKVWKMIKYLFLGLAFFSKV